MASNLPIIGDSRERLHSGERGGSFNANNDPALRIMNSRVSVIRRGLAAMRDTVQNVYRLELDVETRTMMAGAGTREIQQTKDEEIEAMAQTEGFKNVFDELIREGVGSTEYPEVQKYQQPQTINADDARKLVERALESNKG